MKGYIPAKLLIGALDLSTIKEIPVFYLSFFVHTHFSSEGKAY